jgi:hypothetical protein
VSSNVPMRARERAACVRGEDLGVHLGLDEFMAAKSLAAGPKPASDS